MKISQYTLNKNKTKLSILDCLTNYYSLYIHFDNDIEGNNRIKNFKAIARDVENELEKLVYKHLNLKEDNYTHYNYMVTSEQGNISDGCYTEKYDHQCIDICVGKAIKYVTPNTSIFNKKEKELSIKDVEPIFKEIYNYVLNNYND